MSTVTNPAAYRLLALKHALRLEVLGLRHSRGSAYATIKREFGLRGSKQAVSAAFDALVAKTLAAAPPPEE